MVTYKPGSVDGACLDPNDRGPERLLARKAVGLKGCGPEGLLMPVHAMGPMAMSLKALGLHGGQLAAPCGTGGTCGSPDPPALWARRLWARRLFTPSHAGSPSCVCITHELSSAGNCKMPQEVHEVWGTGQQRRSADNVFEHHHSPTHRVAGSRPEASSVTGRKLCGPTNSGP